DLRAGADRIEQDHRCVKRRMHSFRIFSLRRTIPSDNRPSLRDVGSVFTGRLLHSASARQVLEIPRTGGRTQDCRVIDAAARYRTESTQTPVSRDADSMSPLFKTLYRLRAEPPFNCQRSWPESTRPERGYKPVGMKCRRFDRLLQRHPVMETAKQHDD